MLSNLPPKSDAEILLEQRRQAYARLFTLGIPMGGDVEIVMDDLFKFCRGAETTHHPDRAVSDMLAGRREVLLRILEHTELPFEELFKRYHTKGTPR